MKVFFFALTMLCLLPACAQSPVRVMTYNIRFDNPGDAPNHWSGRKSKVDALLKKYDPDIFGVQEALAHQLMDIKKGLGTYTFVGVGRDDGKDKGEFSAIFFDSTRFNVIDQGTFWLSEQPSVPGSKSWDAAITRVATWAVLSDRETQQRLFVLNTHFDHIGKTARANSAALIIEKLPELSKGLPTIVTGDFNCERNDAPYQTLTAGKNFTLIDPAPEKAPGTFCNFKVGGMECRPIDYIFHSHHWEASDYNVVQDNDGTYYPSDHLPVMVSLKRRP